MKAASTTGEINPGSGVREPVADAITAWNVTSEEELMLALELIAHDKLGEALKTLNEALKRDPDNSSLLANRADLLSRLGMNAQAVADRERAGQRGQSNQLADFGDRLGAYLVDLGIYLIMVLLLAVTSLALGAPVILILPVIAFLYLWIANSADGTIGKKVFRLRVVSEQSGVDIGLGMGLLRLVFWYLGALPLFLGWLWVLWDEKKQAWHDKVVGSLVVKNSEP